jgi:hypothetical protein
MWATVNHQLGDFVWDGFWQDYHITYYLVGGDLNHGILNDFPVSWEWKIIPADGLHHFSEG